MILIMSHWGLRADWEGGLGHARQRGPQGGKAAPPGTLGQHCWSLVQTLLSPRCRDCSPGKPSHTGNLAFRSSLPSIGKRFVSWSCFLGTNNSEARKGLDVEPQCFTRGLNLQGKVCLNISGPCPCSRKQSRAEAATEGWRIKPAPSSLPFPAKKIYSAS